MVSQCDIPYVKKLSYDRIIMLHHKLVNYLVVYIFVVWNFVENFRHISSYLPPPQARNTSIIFLRNNNNNRISQENVKHFAPARLLSQRCIFYQKVAHPSVSLLSCTGMSLKWRKQGQLSSLRIRWCWYLRQLGIAVIVLVGPCCLKNKWPNICWNALF